MTVIQLRNERKRLENELAGVIAAIAQAEQMCGRSGHKWGKVEYTPIVHEGYQDHGDPPGTMGVDRRLPMWVPGSIEKIWTRTCTQCGKTETTKLTKKQRVAGSVPGTTGEVEVPDFPDSRW